MMTGTRTGRGGMFTTSALILLCVHATQSWAFRPLNQRSFPRRGFASLKREGLQHPPRRRVSALRVAQEEDQVMLEGDEDATSAPEEDRDISEFVSLQLSEDIDGDCDVGMWNEIPGTDCAVISDPQTYQIRSGPNLLANAVLAGGLLAWAFFSFSTVDSDLWRGWTTEETLLRLLPDAWRAYEGSLEVDPVSVKAFITAVTYFLGDWLAQAVNNNKEAPNDPFGWLAVNRVRLLRGFIVGAPLGVLAHYYYGLNDSLIGDWPLVAKIFVDQTLYLFIYNTCYYLGASCLSGKSPKEALDDYLTKWWNLLSAGWKLWPVVGIITYTIIPLQHRLLWIDAIEIVYSAILSSVSNQAEEPAAE